MLVDAFHRLTHSGFQIMDYQYTGFGSIYFVDFILFHRLLGITKMLSVEHDAEITRRVNFNKPFKGVEIAIKPIGDVIPTLSQDLKHVLWLDYDDIIRKGELEDVVQAAINLPAGSILLITVDVEPPAGDRPEMWKEHYDAEAGDYLGARQNLKEFTRSRLPILNAYILSQVIKSGLVGRQIKFLQLFNFLYKDTHRMLTLGGMIAGESEERMLRMSSLDKTPYYRPKQGSVPYEIVVPRVTRKERIYLDRVMPCSNGWRPKEFELSKKEVTAYRDIYRLFPAYAELLV